MKFLKKIIYVCEVFGIDPVKFVRSVLSIPSFLIDYKRISSQLISNNDFKTIKFTPCLADRFESSGSASGHYFHQDLLIASKIYKNNPIKHIDVGSRVDGFVAHVASFRKIFVIDIRPLKVNIQNIEFLQADLMGDIDESFESSCDSISCLHALEHFGLGRYGDPVCANGYLLGFNNLTKILKFEGKIYLSVPIGPARIEFNAHRVFSISILLKMFDGILRLDEFSYVDDAGVLHEKITLDSERIDNNCNCFYGLGIFEMTKIKSDFR
jgi:hypothetical protein